MSTHPHELVVGKYWQPSFGQRLAIARKDAGLDQEAMALRLEISVQSVSRYENDVFPRWGMKPSYLARWAMETGYDLQWLEKGIIPDQPQPPPPPPIDLDKRRAKKSPHQEKGEFHCSEQIAA